MVDSIVTLSSSASASDVHRWTLLTTFAWERCRGEVEDADSLTREPYLLRSGTVLELWGRILQSALFVIDERGNIISEPTALSSRLLRLGHLLADC